MPRLVRLGAAARRRDAPKSCSRRMWMGRAGPTGKLRTPAGAAHAPWRGCGGAVCGKWLLRLLARQVVELGIGDLISYESAGRTPKIDGFSC